MSIKCQIGSLKSKIFFVKSMKPNIQPYSKNISSYDSGAAGLKQMIFWPYKNFLK